MGFLFFISLLIFLSTFHVPFKIFSSSLNKIQTLRPQCSGPFHEEIVSSTQPPTTDSWLLSISQILSGQYHIWHTYILVMSKKQSRKNYWMMEIINKGLSLSKWEAENTSNNIPKFIRPICLQNFEISLKKASLRVRSPCTQPRRLLVRENCISFPAFRGWNFSSFL